MDGIASEEKLHIASFPSSCAAPRARLGGGAENVAIISSLVKRTDAYVFADSLVYPSFSTVLLLPLEPKRLSAWSAL